MKKKAKFEYFKGRDGQWYWRLRAKNGKIVCISEGYSTLQGALNGISSVKDNAFGAEIIQTEE